MDKNVAQQRTTILIDITKTIANFTHWNVVVYCQGEHVVVNNTTRTKNHSKQLYNK